MSGDGRRIARNASSSYAFRVVLGLSALVLTPFLFRTLGADGFGTWSVMFVVASVFELLELGFSAGVTKRVAELRAGDRRAELNQTLGASVVLMGAIGVAGAGITFAIALLAPGLAAESERGAFQLGMAALGIALLLRLPFTAYGAALLGYQRYDFFNASRGTTVTVFSVGAVSAVLLGGGVLGVAVAYSVALLIDPVLYALFLARTDRNLSLRPHTADSSTRRSVTSVSSYVLLADSMTFIALRMDAVIIAALRSAAAAAPYAAALKLQTGLQSLTLPFVYLLLPMTSDLWARGRRDEVVRRLRLATRVALQVTLPVALALALFSEDIMNLWLGRGAPAVAAQILVVLVTVQTITLTMAPAEKVLVGIGRVRPVGVLAFIEGFSNLGLTIVLVSSYGAIGAALGTLFTSALLAPLRIPLVCRAAGTSSLDFARRSLIPALWRSASGVVAMVLVWWLLPPGTVRLLVGVVLGLGLCVVIAVAEIGPGRLLKMLRQLRARKGRGGAAVAAGGSAS